MLEGLAADTSVITYLMAAIGIIGIIAKVINHFTLVSLTRAAANMPKSTHRLIKLVRAKYEHACMIHDSVENIDAFVEKYIYEYRGCLFRIHTWGQIELLSVWFAGILAVLGAFLQFYLYSGFTESVYQYIAAGAAEVVLLAVVMRLSDEPYKIRGVKMYMVDYLDNICAFRLRKLNQREREFIDVIPPESSGRTGFQEASGARAESQGNVAEAAGKVSRASAEEQEKVQGRGERTRGISGKVKASRFARSDKDEREAKEENGKSGQYSEGDLPINIEGEPRKPEKGEAARQAVRHSAADREVQDADERPALREETIRQILEEFLA